MSPVVDPAGVPDLSQMGARQVQLEEAPIEVLWQNFGIFRHDQLFPVGYPQAIRRLFAPIDDVHKAITTFVGAARLSLACAMYGWDDDEIDQTFRTKLQDEKLPVQLALDSTQAAGLHERDLLKRWSADQIGNSVAIGRSSKGAISHTKLIVIDGIITIQGSTNLSTSGETKQNNECTFIMDPIFAAETRARIDVIHDEMLTQMAKKKGA